MLAPTRRQIEVLRARCETGSRAAAAKRLGISPHTVATHLRLLLALTRCTDDAQACYRLVDEMRALNGSQADDPLKL